MSRKFFLFVCVFFFSWFLPASAGHNKEEWKERAIYQLLTDRFAHEGWNNATNCDLSKYCGGNHKGIIERLDYIQGMGFDAIWISPVVKNTEGSYHGYHLIDLYKFNEHFGNEQDFIELIEECHKRGIWVMVDVVANHVGPVGMDFGRINPFNKAEHYHDRCQIQDWNNQWQVENCRLCDLPDLKQENGWVTQTLLDWITDFVKKYDIDGIRIDTIPEVPKWFWDKFSKASGVYQLGEVFNGNPHYVAGYQGHVDGLFNYPLYYSIKDSFCGSMKNLETFWWNTMPMFPDASVMGVFVENHDNARFLNMCGDRKKFKNAAIFSLFWTGIPVFYYGGEQYFNGGGDPYNRETLWGHYNTKSDLYIALGKANKVRKTYKIWKEKQVQRYADDQFYAFTRGKVLIAVTRGETVERTITYHEYSKGTKLCNVLKDGDCYTVENSGIHLKMSNSDPKVLVPK